MRRGPARSIRESFKRAIQVPLWRLAERFFLVGHFDGIALIDIRGLGRGDDEEFRSFAASAIERVDSAGREFAELIRRELRFIAAGRWPREQILFRVRGYGTPWVGERGVNVHTLALQLVWVATYLELCRDPSSDGRLTPSSAIVEREVRRACYQRQLAFSERFDDFERWERYIEENVVKDPYLAG